MTDLGKDLIPLPHKELLLTEAKATRAIDELCSEKGLSSEALMETAGRLVSDYMLRLGNFKGIFVILGTGNNAGDGLVAARYLHLRGVETELVFVDWGQKGSELFQTQKKICGELAIKHRTWMSGRSWPRKSGWIYLDCLFGSGFRASDKLAETPSAAIHELRSALETVVAVDIASGLDPDGAAPAPSELPPGERITLALDTLKFSHISQHSKDLTGELHVLDLGIPRAWTLEAFPQSFKAYLEPTCTSAWARTSRDSYKHLRGYVLVIGGSRGLEGAAALASTASLRAGAGYVGVAMPEDTAERQVSEDWKGFHLPVEAVQVELYEKGKLSASCLSKMIETSKKLTTILLGPGWKENLLDDDCLAVLGQFSKRGGGVVFDAGATHGLWPLIERHSFDPLRTIALPHPGEWAMLAAPFSDVTPKSWHDLTKIDQAVRHFGRLSVVFKSTRPIVFHAGPRSLKHLSSLFSMPHRRLAKAGTGDVIAGATAALLHVSDDAATAFSKAYNAVVLASQKEALRRGDDGVLPSDYLGQLGKYV